jgi:hypothetical protein
MVLPHAQNHCIWPRPILQLLAMTDATEKITQPEPARLLVVAPPASRTREGRPATILANAFGQFAEMQQMVGDQVIALEASVDQQGQQLSDLSAQLPDMKERINWLIASYYEENHTSQSLQERLTRQEESLGALADAVRCLCEAQAQWKQTLDRLMQAMTGGQAPAAAPQTRWPE